MGILKTPSFRDVALLLSIGVLVTQFFRDDAPQHDCPNELSTAQ
jgi:hypothetical protein